MNKIKPILQLTRTECGICCVAMLASYYGYKKPIRYFREKIDIGRDGVSVSELKEILMESNFDVAIYKMSEFDFERKNLFPSIIHTKQHHFMVLEKYDRKKNIVKLIDPGCGRIEVSMNQLFEMSNDFILYATPNVDFKPEVIKESIWKPLTFLIKDVSLKFVISLVLSIVTYFFSLAIPLLIQTLIDRFSIQQRVIVNGVDISLAIAAIAFFLVVSYLRNKVVVETEVIIDKNLLVKLMDRILRLPYKYFEIRTTGEILFRINLLNSIRLLISEGLIRGIIDVGSVLFILGYMSLLAPSLMPGIVLVLVLIFVTANFINNRAITLNKDELSEQAQISNIETETIEMMFDIKCLGVEELFLSRLKTTYSKFQQRFKDREMISRCNVSLLQFFQLFVPFILLLVNMLMIQHTKLSIGMVVAFYTLSNMIITNCIALVQEVTNFRLMKNYILRINDILCEKEEEQKDNKPIKKFENLTVDQLSFKYSKNSNLILNKVEFEVNKGQKIAIVGGSGEGKSTLIKLLLGLYEPILGSVKYNGIDIRELDKKQLKKIIGIMPQDAKLFNGSIRYNITLGDDSIPEDVVKDALKKANIYDDIMKMPLKENTVLSAGGINLSGGQRQRIALARMLVLDPQVLILDEATSSLDGINEKEILNVLNKCSCTQIIISHRLSTILQADYVYVIKNGVIAEKGTINELIRNQGLFIDLFGKQLESENLLGDD